MWWQHLKVLMFITLLRYWKSEIYERFVFKSCNKKINSFWMKRLNVWANSKTVLTEAKLTLQAACQTVDSADKQSLYHKTTKVLITSEDSRVTLKGQYLRMGMFQRTSADAYNLDRYILKKNSYLKSGDVTLGQGKRYVLRITLWILWLNLVSVTCSGLTVKESQQ